MFSRRAAALFLVAPLLVSTAACGDARRLKPSERAVAVSLAPPVATINPAPSPSASPTKAATSAAASSSSAASSSGGAPPAGGGNEVKAVITSKFEPANLDVKVGTEVTFVNAGGVHSVTGGADAPDPASPIGNTMLNAEGNSVKVTFDKPGTYPFFCIPHQSLGMKGQIVVS